MSSTPKRVYVVISPSGRVIGSFTNKKLLHAHLWNSVEFPRAEHTRYESFSQVFKLNGSCFWDTKKGLIKCYEVPCNLLANHKGVQ